MACVPVEAVKVTPQIGTAQAKAAKLAPQIGAIKYSSFVVWAVCGNQLNSAVNCGACVGSNNENCMGNIFPNALQRMQSGLLRQ